MEAFSAYRIHSGLRLTQGPTPAFGHPSQEGTFMLEEGIILGKMEDEIEIGIGQPHTIPIAISTPMTKMTKNPFQQWRRGNAVPAQDIESSLDPGLE